MREGREQVASRELRERDLIGHRTEETLPDPTESSKISGWWLLGPAPLGPLDLGRQPWVLPVKQLVGVWMIATAVATTRDWRSEALPFSPGATHKYSRILALPGKGRELPWWLNSNALLLATWKIDVIILYTHMLRMYMYVFKVISLHTKICSINGCFSEGKDFCCQLFCANVVVIQALHGHHHNCVAWWGRDYIHFNQGFNSFMKQSTYYVQRSVCLCWGKLNGRNASLHGIHQERQAVTRKLQWMWHMKRWYRKSECHDSTRRLQRSQSVGHRVSPTGTGQEQKNELAVSGNKEEGRLAQKRGENPTRPVVRNRPLKPFCHVGQLCTQCALRSVLTHCGPIFTEKISPGHNSQVWHPLLHRRGCKLQDVMAALGSSHTGDK